MLIDAMKVGYGQAENGRQANLTPVAILIGKRDNLLMKPPRDYFSVITSLLNLATSVHPVPKPANIPRSICRA